MSVLTDRMLRAARLDVRVFEEVENDRAATGQAVAVVALASLAGGIGAGAGLGGVLAGALTSLLAWYVWTYITYWIGTRLLPEPGTRADHGELLRTIGFAHAPGVLRVLGVVPGVRGIIFAVTAIWMLVAAVVAVRQALDYSATWRAVLVVVAGWLVQVIAMGVVFLLTGALR